MSKIIFQKNYDAESLCDVERDVYEALNDDVTEIPKDEHGFELGTFKITIEWESE